MNWLSTHCYAVLAAPKWQVTTNTNKSITICTFVGEHDDSEWSTLSVWEPDVMVVAMPTPSPNRSPKKQGISLSNRQICNILCCRTYFPYSLKHVRKSSKKSFSENLWIRKNDPCCLFFFRAPRGHKYLNELPASVSDSILRDWWVPQGGPLPVPQLAIEKGHGEKTLFTTESKSPSTNF